MVIKSNVIVLLTRFKDETFIWTTETDIHGPFQLAETKAVGKWLFKINPAKIQMCINTLRILGHDIVKFRNGYYNETYRVDYEEMKNE
jgi:hypothetical protein